MKNTKIEKVELLNIVKQNLAKHLADHAEAVTDYKTGALKLAKTNLEYAETGDLEQISKIAGMPNKPVSYESEYNRAIRKLELSVDTVIEVDEMTFNQLVLDEWNWKAQFLVGNAFYKTLH
jgi:hypothetical protein